MSNFDAVNRHAAEAAALLKVLGHPERLLVLCHLVEGERSVGELAIIAGLNQSALSQHLGKMRLQGLVTTRRDGQTIYYSLASREVRKVLADASMRVTATLQGQRARLEALAQMLLEKEVVDRRDLDMILAANVTPLPPPKQGPGPSTSSPAAMG